MHRRTVLQASATALAATLASQLNAAETDDETRTSFETVIAFMDAMGRGDMAGMGALMADDMVWHNEGDTTLPWIGETTGKENIFAFLGVFSSNLETTRWENTDAFASGNTVAVFGKMAGVTTRSGQPTGDFTFALRAKVRDRQVVLWHWFEDSFAISQAYHG